MRLTDDELAYIERLLSPLYCTRCESLIGDSKEENFCTVCWKPRRPIPLQLRRLLKAVLED